METAKGTEGTKAIGREKHEKARKDFRGWCFDLHFVAADVAAATVSRGIAEYISSAQICDIVRRAGRGDFSRYVGGPRRLP
jgi:hypothetical protein